MNSGHAYLNYMISRINPSKSDLCDTCYIKEYIIHYLYDCKKFDEERKTLEQDIDRNLVTNVQVPTSHEMAQLYIISLNSLSILY